MSSQKLQGLMINRLLVLLQIILIPVYFIFFSIRWHSSIQQFFDNLLVSAPFLAPLLPSWLIWFEVNLGIPIFFSLPWVVFSIMRATRIADSYELMGRALGRVRIDQKLFYGINAAFTLIFLIFPFFSPLITIIGLIWSIRVILRKLWIGKISKWIWIIPALVLSMIPILIAIAFYSNYIVLFNEIFNTWQVAIPTLFGIGLTLAIAIALGNFLLFLFEGSVKYGGYDRVPYEIVFVFKVIVFIILILVYFNTDPPTIVNIINYIAVFLGFFELIMRRVRGLPNKDGTASGIVMVIAFSLVNILLNAVKQNTALTQWAQTLVVVLSGMIFFILFWLSYTYAPEEFEYGSDDEE